MSHEFITAVTAFSIIIAAILGAIRFRQIPESYYPFVFICWLGFAFEIFAFLFQVAHKTLLPSNIYVLIEGLLFVWLFQKWGAFNRWPVMFILLQVFVAGLWLVDTFFIVNIHRLSVYYRIGYSGMLTILAIDHINKLIITERSSFLTNAKFLICISIIIFFSYKLIVEVFYMNLSSEENYDFLQKVYRMQQYVNLFVNLLFAYVMLWIPRKKVFLEPLPS